jgi:hypothetical protein
MSAFVLGYTDKLTFYLIMSTLSLLASIYMLFLPEPFDPSESVCELDQPEIEAMLLNDS